MPVRLALFILVALGAALYSQTLRSPFVFDDIPSIVENTRIRDLLDIQAVWDFIPTRFMTYWSLALNYRFGQLDVLGYHLANIAIHLAASCIAYFLVLSLFETPRLKDGALFDKKSWIAFFSAAFFAAHPIQTQAVTYVIQRSASMAALFYLASLLFYARSRISSKNGFFWAALVSGIMALFSKEYTVTLPLAVCLYESVFWESAAKDTVKRSLPFLGLVALMAVTIAATNGRAGAGSGGMIRMLGETAAIPWTHYFFTQLTVIATYLRLLVLPLGQNLDYDYPLFESLFTPPVLGSGLLLAALLVAAFKLRRGYPLLFFSLAWFFMTLLPESSVFPIKDVIFEHRLYLPMAGYGLFLSAVTFSFFERKGPKKPLIILTILLAGYSIMTWQRNLVWKDEMTLWTDVIEKSPQKARPYNNRGNVHRNGGRLDEALADYDKAVLNDPTYPETYSNRGTVHQAKGPWDKALADFNKAIELKPDMAKAYTNRGSVYAAQKRWDKAFEDFDKAIRLQPDLAGAYNNRGRIHQIQGRRENAIADFTTALKLKPSLEAARKNLANVLKETRG